jgi:hypothetical protein
MLDQRHRRIVDIGFVHDECEELLGAGEIVGVVVAGDVVGSGVTISTDGAA